MDEFIKIFGLIADSIGIGGAVLSLLIWLRLKREEKFNEQQIKILLTMPSESFKLPYEIERKHLTSSDLQGLLVILPRNTVQYQLSFLNTPDFFVKLKAAQNDKDTTSIKIICYKNEVAQFDLDKIRQQCTVTDIT